MIERKIARINCNLDIKEQEKYIKAYLRLFNDADNLIFLSKTNINFTDEMVRSWLKQSDENGTEYYVVYDKCDIVAIMIIMYNTIDCFEVLSLVVDEKYRRLGLAASLLEKAEKLAKDKGFRAVTIKVFADNSRMLSLVIQKGYKPVKIEYRIRFDGEDMVCLQKYINMEW